MLLGACSNFHKDNVPFSWVLDHVKLPCTLKYTPDMPVVWCIGYQYCTCWRVHAQHTPTTPTIHSKHLHTDHTHRKHLNSTPKEHIHSTHPTEHTHWTHPQNTPTAQTISQHRKQKLLEKKKQSTLLQHKPKAFTHRTHLQNTLITHTQSTHTHSTRQQHTPHSTTTANTYGWHPKQTPTLDADNTCKHNKPK